MEVVGAVASIVALVQVGKQLKECVDKIPINRQRIQDVVISIGQDLENLQELAHSRQMDVNAPKLSDAISSLEADLSMALARCEKMLKSLTQYGWLRRAVLWKDSDDIEVELMRIERRVANCCRRFSLSGIARVELSLVEVTGMTDQIREEVSDRLNFLEDHLGVRVAKAEADPSYAETLVGTRTMSNPVLKNALSDATAELEHSSPTALESRYLHLKVETLANAVRLLPSDERIHPPPFSRAPSGTHLTPTGDPAEQNEDVIMGTVRLIRALRTRDASVPVTQIAADLERLSMQLIDLGMYEDARQTYSQVVRIYRGSVAAEARPPIIDARVARALIGVSVALQRLGKSKEGLVSIREAESIFRFLEAIHPRAFERELGLTLNNKANHLRDSGFFAEATETAKEAVHIRRRLAEEAPELHKADLAASLLNASTCYSKIPGLEHEALVNVLEAVTISRQLVAMEPQVFEPYLGASLHNAANRQADDKDAYECIQEAVLIRRKLSTSRPQVFSGGLMRSLAVARKLALRCGDSEGAARFYEEHQRLTTSESEAATDVGGINLGTSTVLAAPTRKHEAMMLTNPPSPGVSAITAHSHFPDIALQHSMPQDYHLPEEYRVKTGPEATFSPFPAYSPNTALHQTISPAYVLERYTDFTPQRSLAASAAYPNASIFLQHSASPGHLSSINGRDVLSQGSQAVFGAFPANPINMANDHPVFSAGDSLEERKRLLRSPFAKPYFKGKGKSTEKKDALSRFKRRVS